MAWLYGDVYIEEAIAEITKLAVQNIMEKQRNGWVNITLECDGSYVVNESEEERLSEEKKT